MGNLKPVGSEKLQGMAKINRIMEIARYKENKPQSINETTSNEYSIKMSDGYNYFIVKEKNGYVIKRGLNESNAEYLAPMQNTKYFSSYSQAFKKLNLMAKEINSVEGERKNISLFTEGESMDDKRYFLKHPKMGTKMETMEQGSPTQPPTQATAPVPAPAPAQAPPPQSPPADLALPQDDESGDEMGDEEMPDETSVDSDTEETQPSEEKVTFKTIQKLTGKLAQKIRTLSSDEENPMSSKDIKYVINSILSALDLESLDEDDREQIISKMEGLEDEEGAEELPSDSEEDGNEEGEEVAPEAPQPPAQEVPEGYNSIDEEDFYMSPKINKGDMNEYDSKKMDEMIESIFSESKVDKVLQKYFKYSKKEKTNKIIKDIDNLSESVSQRVSARKFYNKNKNINLLGKSDNGKLIFMNESDRYSIDKYGRII